ncbi:filament-like plant protein 7 isoform X2 [Andrographis paniculata]|nr:filament-like plant protein 7 isoform X2 [Andrographis paniculata]XP_051147821.1 filament-like plant protein 7 isoform X2 [Andrographis paniculata]XP_051147822.1 filament-like plant protein 7 isoform X2 [Andrographis paniculata]
MDQKTWLWRKRSSEKTIVANGDDEEKPVPKEADLEISLKELSEKLAAVVDECSEKDKLAERCQKMADDAIADKIKAEEEAHRLKEELDEVIEQRGAANERLANLNSAFKDCMDQLNNVRNDQDRKLKEAITQTSKESKTAHKKLEEQLSEANKRLATAAAETSYLGKALIVKEKLINDLTKIKNQTEAEFEALMSRLDSTEKENTFLRYEFRALEKELEYCRGSVEASNKQNSDNVKKIKKLEGDCQRLRALTRKRIPGPTIMANVKSDIEVYAGSRIDTRRKSLHGGFITDYSPENVCKKLGVLTSRVRDLEKENEIFKELLMEKEEQLLHYQKLQISTSLVAEEKTEHECKIIGASDMSLMDDFVEMERLAIVAVDLPVGGGSFSSMSDLDSHMNVTTKELVPVGIGEEPSSDKPNDWVMNVANTIVEQHRISKKSINDLLGDVKLAANGIAAAEPSKLVPISGYLTWKSPPSTPRSNSLHESSNELLQPDLSVSLGKIINIVRKFYGNLPDDDNNSKAGECKIHVFRWRSRELSDVLMEFIGSCKNLSDGMISYDGFVRHLASTLGWITDNCVSYDDRSTVRDEFSKHLSGEGPGTAMELECVQNLMLEIEKIHSALKVEIKALKNEVNRMKLSKNDPEFAILQTEIEVLKESGRMTEDRIEDLKAINEDLDTQLTVTKSKLGDALQKLSCVEVELDNKIHCCEELEGICLELQLQLESTTKNQNSKNGSEEELLQTGMEITKASAKLAECEETILKLGKQLKSLGSSKELSVFDKVLSITGATSKKFKQRSSLREMLSEDYAQRLKHSKEMTTTAAANGQSISRTSSRSFSFSDNQADKYLGTRKDSRAAKSGALVVVPKKNTGGRGIGFLTTLLLRRKKSSSKSKSLW